MMDEIPFKCVSYNTWIKLANKLDPAMSVKCNNWRILADKLGYSTDEIMVFECKQSPHGRNTIKVFEEYVKKSGSTVEKVQEALEQMERPDALGILLDALPDIQKKHEIARTTQQRQDQAIQNEMSMPSYSTGHSRELWEHSNLHGYPNKRKPPTHHALPVHMLAKPADTNQLYQRNRSPHVLNSTDLPNLNHVMTRESPPSHIDDKDEEMDYMASPHPGQPLADGVYREHHLSSVQHSLHFTRGDQPFPEDEASTTQSPEANYYPVYERLEMNSPQQLAANRILLYHRQMSEEQPLHDPKLDRTKVKLNIDNISNSVPMKTCNNSYVFNSPSPTTPVSDNPLDQLKLLATLGRFRPDGEFNKMMQEKHEEELLQQRMQCPAERMLVKDEKFCNSCRYATNSNPFFAKTHHKCKETSKCQAPKETSKTFPMRIRSSTTDGYTKESSKQVGLVKSISMPNDMKPAEYHKALRQIKVFVTYAADTHRHIQCVLNLCNCLEKNRFTCCMDIYHRRLQMEDRLGWFDDKFKEADFILVCVSAKYKLQVEQNDVLEENSVTDNCLHTKYIYNLMHNEFVRNNSTNTRFIPLLFDTASRDDVPSWLQNTLIYKWSQDWKDLMWMLTKPEERIKPRSKSYLKNSKQSKPCCGK